MAASLPYHEPGIEDILILSTFLLALNAINSLLDRTLYCGLVGQVLVGIAWGTPGGKWLSPGLEHAVVQLGYLGLIMMVFEGGLSATISGITANLVLSTCVALTGIAVPIGLSFVLGPLVGASPLQCFAAGAALCATSLGTTFAVLSTSGLVRTRLGSILSTAAMMDDVVGLVMVQVVASLGGQADGGGGGGFAPALVVRPVLVSVAFAIVLPLACCFVLRPLLRRLWKLRADRPRAALFRLADKEQTTFAVHTAVLLACVVGAAYAGASVLLAAYLAGITGSWWRDERARLERSIRKRPAQSAETARDPATTPTRASGGADGPANHVDQPESGSSSDGSVDVYEKYYQQAVERVLKPFFFASVGFSIPISQMFAGPVVWRGIIYTILMMLGKVVCGAWLVRVPAARRIGTGASSAFASAVRSLTRRVRPGRLMHKCKKGAAPTPPAEGSHRQQNPVTTVLPPSAPVQEKQEEESPAPLSLYPAGIISCAMTARGEIGFLISSVAETKGVFRQGPADAAAVSDIFLIVTWAIVLCTILGPLGVGLLVRRVKRLETQSSAAQVEGHKRNALGVWGVS